MNIIEQLNWRYATKIFDKTKKINKQDLEDLLESFRLSATSFGFQHYELLVIETPKIREALLPFTWNQKQATDASHYFVLCTKNQFTEQDVDNHTSFIGKVRNQEPERTAAYNQRIRKFLVGKSTENIFNYLENQTFIALGTLMTVCAMKNIDSCAIGGFEREKYDEILGLTEKGLTASVCLAVGYRSSEDSYQSVKKVRKPIDKVVQFI